MAKQLLLILALAVSVSAKFEGWIYDPEHPTEPFDEVAKAVTDMIHGHVPVDRRDDNWQGNFCSCMENGHISSWYQYASAMYLIDTCNPKEGFIMRSGHLQDRHVEPLQGMMACDTLKLITYCLSHHAQEALPTWEKTCNNAHYTTPACNVDCSGAMHRFGGFGLVALAAVAFFGFSA
mmetsp:Transcript_67433/g.175035  ORF Transcript_67433/g.175035 Transcript_67433/m.175035 type:complete len:178 (-) Transcript_67433:80-613(-)